MVRASPMRSFRSHLTDKVNQTRLALLLLCLVVAGCRPTPNPATSQSTPSPSSVTALGRLEPADGVIDISAAPGDRILKVLVKEGDEVTLDQELVVLESQHLREDDQHLAEKQLQEAKDRLKAIDSAGEAQKREAEIKLKGAKDAAQYDILMLEQKKTLLTRQLAFAEQNLRNLDSLGAGSVPEQEKEKQRLAVASAASELYANDRQLEKARAAQVQADREGQAQLEALAATLRRTRLEVPLEAAEHNLKMAGERVKQSKVTAPTSGVILSVLIHPGEVTGGRPLLRMGDTARLAVIAEVDEADILRVEVGQKATVDSPTLKKLVEEGQKTTADSPTLKKLEVGKLPGVVEQVGRTFASNQVMELNPAAQTSRRVVEVKILLDLKGFDKKVQQGVKRLIHHQVHVTIETPPGE